MSSQVDGSLGPEPSQVLSHQPTSNPHPNPIPHAWTLAFDFYLNSRPEWKQQKPSHPTKETHFIFLSFLFLCSTQRIA